MSCTDHPKFEQLRRRLGGEAKCFDASPSEKARLIGYLQDHGCTALTLQDLVSAVQTLEDEELSAFSCEEGVAISHASDGWWLLLSDDDEFFGHAGERAIIRPVTGGERC